ncbi:hypothetical protein BH11PSE10_BH11PSE10_20300 [soil metagenome]
MPDTNASAYEALVEFLYRAPIGLVQTRLDGEITMINPMSAQLLMPLAPDGDLLNLFDVLAKVAPQLRQIANEAHAPGGVICDGLRLPLAAAAADSGSPLTLALSLLKIDANTLMASVSDVTLVVQKEQQRLTRKLNDATRIDGLTKMPTRAVVVERIAAALHRAVEDPDYQFAVLFINADRFNRINVTLGQASGDELIVQMAGRLNGTVRQRDSVGITAPASSSPSPSPPTSTLTAGRLNGDEFVVVLEGMRRAEDVERIAQRLVDALNKPYRIAEQAVHSSCSMGVVTRSHAAASADAVLQDASLAMREAKRSGGGRFCVFVPLMKELAWRRGSLETELRLALSEGQLFVVYQPIIWLKTGAIAGFEALVRWRHPQRGIVGPIEFIDIAEETGLIGALGEFVLNTACRQIVAWQRQFAGHAAAVISVNLSRAQLVEPEIVEQVDRALQTSGLAAQYLQLEVTESLAAQDQQVQFRLHALKALGLSLALDDFGTGYSSLASLHQLPVDVVKIDRSFVSQSESSAHHRVLIEATVKVARSLGMQTVAEGIETEGQAAILTALNCDKGQGYLYARLLPAEEVPAWLASWHPR